MHYDIAIIGGGPGGYVAAIYAGKKKAKVALVEKGELGGTCLNRGCIPTKSLIHGANLLQAIKSAKDFGITADNVNIDWDKLQKKTSRIVKTLTKGVENLLKANNVTVMQGRAKLSRKNTIEISGETGQSTITADNIILATGSVPTLVPIPGKELQNVMTSDQALFLGEIPSSILIIGGGVIGLEIGYVYNSFGCRITVVEMLPEILPRQDKEISLELKKQLERQGIEIYTDSMVRKIREKDGILQTVIETKEGTKTVDSEKILMATGRAPAVDAFKDIGLHIEKSGVVVDEYLKTNIDNIYAVGDVTGKSMLAHVASHQGITAVKNILGENEKIDYKAIPSCVYTSPEVASVGMTEDEARRLFRDNIRVGRFPYAASGKAKTLGEVNGFVKIISESKYNEILGVHIVGPSATELIAEAVLAIKLECTAEELANTIHAHPTLSEATMEAAFDLLAEPIHKL
ncbi:MAG: dihydrolipoyl dehydrogenase [Tepidanaerobacteraceae bacterium]|jgi:dihydrolipoamide dehydrogenase|nr:dihydrolipoyl dehydrogenase [Tepidanaerobacteraceae bacterium]HQE05175.1 dihydrolipoyl dehydrogenase [Tepidanaerobacteraceae bacterium]